MMFQSLQWRLFGVLSLMQIPVYSLLYPQESSTREMKSLDGLWKFRLSPSLQPQTGFEHQWFANNSVWYNNPEVLDMPVPASYNDIPTDGAIRDFVGWAWYFRTFYVPQSWNEKIVMLRFGSAHYTAQVWLNGQEVGLHSGGHLPFEWDISSHLHYSRENTICVAVNNTLTPYTIPQGSWQWTNNEITPFKLVYTFDFFNYAGIHRPVWLYTKPKEISVKDVTVFAQSINVENHSAVLKYHVEVEASHQAVQCNIKILDAQKLPIAEFNNCMGTEKLQNIQLWWPYLMNPTVAYMYTMDIMVHDLPSGSKDAFSIPFGIRTIEWNASSLLVNGQPFYFRGFGKHEDSDLRGKGLDWPLVTRDFHLIKWIGANSFRTSHYPYAEEIMDMADKQGIMVINECPGVNLHTFDSDLLLNHMQVMKALIARDKNRPSVIAWSIANEPVSNVDAAKPYFQEVADLARSLDPQHRPITAALSRSVEEDKAAEALDIVAINRYFGWYDHVGDLQRIKDDMYRELTAWKAKYPEKLLMVTEYGADTISGFHTLPSSIWTEDYQWALMEQTTEAFDQFANQTQGWVGEMIWNFADFMTQQQINRAVGNKKGIFTRQRQPKASAYMLRKRYWKLASLADEQ